MNTRIVLSLCLIISGATRCSLNPDEQNVWQPSLSVRLLPKSSNSTTNTTASRAVHFATLPDDIVRIVVDILVAQEDFKSLKALAQVSQRERRLTNHVLDKIQKAESLKKPLKLIVVPRTEKSELLHTNAQDALPLFSFYMGDTVEELNLPNCHIVTLTGIENFKKLTRLSLAGNHFGDEGISLLTQASVAPSLERLNIANTGVTARSIALLAESCPKLQELTLSTSEDLDSIKKALRQKFKIQEQQQSKL